MAISRVSRSHGAEATSISPPISATAGTPGWISTCISSASPGAEAGGRVGKWVSSMTSPKAHAATTMTSTSAVGPGQTTAKRPAPRSIRPTSRWPRTGPAVRLVNDRAPCSPASMNAYTAKRMTSARMVTPGQAIAAIPMITARTPRTISEVDNDLDMTGFFRVRLGARVSALVAPAGFGDSPIRVPCGHALSVDQVPDRAPGDQEQADQHRDGGEGSAVRQPR